MARTIDEIRRLTNRKANNGRGIREEREISPSSNGRSIEDIRRLMGRETTASDTAKGYYNPIVKDNNTNIPSSEVTNENPFRYNSLAEYDEAIKAAEPTGLAKADKVSRDIANGIANVGAGALNFVNFGGKIYEGVTGKNASITANDLLPKSLEYTDNDRALDQLKAEREKFASEHAWDEYAKLMSNEDFEANSAYKGPVTESEQLDYMLYGDNGVYGSLQGGSKYARLADNFTDEEKKVGQYIYNTQGEKAFNDYVNQMSLYADKRAYEAQKQQVQDWADEGNGAERFGKNALLSAGTVVGDTVGGIGAAGERVASWVQGRSYNPYGMNAYASSMSGDIREGVAEDIEQALPNAPKILGQNAASFLYQTGMSAADSVAGATLFGEGYTYLMGANAYNTSYKDLKESGASDFQANMGALASGVAEAFFEKYSLENLLAEKAVISPKQFIKETLKQAGVEASEETFTELANILSDTIIMGGNSEIQRRYTELQNQGYTNEQIEQILAQETRDRIYSATLGGALSGGFMSGGYNAIQYHNLSNYGNTVDRNKISDLGYEGEAAELKKGLVDKYGDEWTTKSKNAEIGNLYNTHLNQTMSKLDETSLKAAESAIAKTYDISRKEASEYAKAILQGEKSRILDTHFGEVLLDDYNNETGWYKNIEANDNFKVASEYAKTMDARKTTSQLNAEKASKVLKVGKENMVHNEKAHIISMSENKDGSYTIETDKGTYKAKDVTVDQTTATALAWSVNIADKGLKEAYVANYEGQDINDYDMYSRYLYEWGKRGTDWSDKAESILDTMSLERANAIYEAGMEVGKKANEIERNDLNKIAEKLSVKSGTIKGGSLTDGKFTEDKSFYRNLKNTEKRLFHVIEALSKFAGINFQVVNDPSDTSINGEFVAGKDGGTITINLAARPFVEKTKENGEYNYVISTLAHEMTHWMKANDREAYNALEQAIVETLTERGTLEKYIKAEQDNYKKNFGEELDRETALEEVVARACEDMLNDSKTLEEILTHADPEGLAKIKAAFERWLEHIKEFIDELMAYFKSPNEIVRSLENEYNNLRELWLKGIQSAMGDNSTNSKKTINDIDKNALSVEIESNIKAVNTMSPVTEISNNVFSKGDKKLSDQVDEFFASKGNRVHNDILGDVDLNRSGIKDDISHGKMTRTKAMTFSAVPDVIEKGKIVDFQKNWKNRGYDTVALCAPITIKETEQEGLVAVILIRNSKNDLQRFYVHNAIIIEDAQSLEPKTGMEINNLYGPGDYTSSVFNILQKVLESKTSDNGVIATDSQSGTAVHSVRYTLAEKYKELGYKTYEDAINGQAEKIGKQMSRTKSDLKDMIAKAKEWLLNEESLASLILGDQEYLDYEADERYLAIKQNSDYPQGTVDLSNLCRKRELFTKMFDRLQKDNPHTLFTAEDIATIRQILMESNYEVACALCYVEDRRQKTGEIAENFIGFYKKALKAKDKVILKLNSEGKWKPLKTTKEQAQKYNLTQGETMKATDDYVPTQYDLTTYAGFKALTENHPVVAAAFENYNNSRGMASARLVEGHAEYMREILKYKADKVESINNNGGLRIFSFSDFEAIHLIDVVQVIMDCASKGIKVQAYTKVPAFANLVKNTGIKLNRSLIPANVGSKNAYAYVNGEFIKVEPTERGIAVVDGKEVLCYDTVEGIDVTDKNFLDMSNNRNIGNICIGVSDKQIEMAMKDPFVDYIIPFHTGQKATVLHQKGIGEWDNYKDYQLDKKIGSEEKDHGLNIYTDVLNKYKIKTEKDFVEAFLKECKKQGYTPRFEQFLNKDEKGNYLYTEGYYKLLLDYKLFDQNGNILPQEVVRPDFDLELMNEILMADKERSINLKFDDEIVDKVKEELGKQGKKVYSTKLSTADIDESAYTEMKEHFGTTNKYNVAGYMLKDGSMLDFSGKHWGDPTSTYRQVDHRDIQEVLPDENNGVDSMVRMIANGNIRLMPENGGINLSQAPTLEQTEVLKRYIRYHLTHEDREVVVDFDEPGKDTVYTLMYDDTANESKILDDIRNYFRGAKQSEIAQFHKYSRKGEAPISSQYGVKKDSIEAKQYLSSAEPNAKRAVLTTRNDLIDFVDKALTNEDEITTRAIVSKVSPRVAADIARLSKGKIIADNAFWEIDAKHIYHSKKHLEGKGADNLPMTKREIVYLLSHLNACKVYTAIKKSNGLKKIQVSVPLSNGEGIVISMYAKGDKTIVPTIYISSEWKMTKEGAKRYRNSKGTNAEHSTKNAITAPLTSSNPNVAQSATQGNKKSLKMDSEGRNLTEGQQNYFKNTYVVDDKGRLKVMYHGTPRGGFTIFNTVRGAFFSDRKEVGQIFAGLAYLDNVDDYVMNPDKPMTFDELATAYSQMSDGELIENADGTFTYESEEGNKTFNELKEAQAYLYDEFISLAAAQNNTAPAIYENYINAENPLVVECNGSYWNNLTFNGEQTYTDEIVEYASKEGYDSVIFKNIVDGGNIESTVVVTFSSNQAKSIYNENPTENEDMRKSTKMSPEERKRLRELERDVDRLTKENNALKEKRQTELERAQRKAIVDKITEQSKTLAKWLLTNPKQSSVPQALRKPIGDLLTSIDYTTSSRAWRERNDGKGTKKDQDMAVMMGRVRHMLMEIDQDMVNDAEAYDLSQLDWLPAFTKEFSEISNAIAEAESERGNKFVLQDLEYEQLESLNNLITALKTSVTNMNKMLGTHNKESVSGVGTEMMRYLESIGPKEIDNSLTQFMEISNTTPYYFFKRLGPAGQKIFKELMDGFGEYAFKAKEIEEFAHKTFNGKEVNSWREDVKEFKISEVKTGDDITASERTIKMTVPQIMSLYCLAKRDQALRHISTGGIKVSTFTEDGKKVKQTDSVTLSQKDLEMITSTLTDEQREVADKLQEFMSTVCAKWGNEVTMKRFGFKQYTEKHYFPIVVDQNVLTKEARQKGSSLYQLLNMGFTKPLNPKAKNPIEIFDIFETFTIHSTDMAQYNTLALPVLDVIRVWNYKEMTDIETDNQEWGQTKDNIARDTGEFTDIYRVSYKSVKSDIEKAIGEKGNAYIGRLLADINGDINGGRADQFGKKLIKNYKTAAVAANIQVALLQPLSYIRAGYAIDEKYLTRALTMKSDPDLIMKYCGIAVWKDMGFYNTAINNGLEHMIMQDDSQKEKLINSSLWLAGKMDELTWRKLWNACELEIRDKTNLAVGSEEYYKAVGERLTDLIYGTQVVDSILTRSDLMRGADLYTNMVTAFNAEPTLGLNILMDAAESFDQTRRAEGKQAALTKCGKQMRKAAEVYLLGSLAESVLRAVWGRIRNYDGDDDDEALLAEILRRFLEELNPLRKIPIIKDVYGILADSIAVIRGKQKQLYTDTRMDEASVEQIGNAIIKVARALNKKEMDYKTIQAIAKGLDASGLPVSSSLRIFKGIWNNTIGRVFDSLLIK